MKRNQVSVALVVLGIGGLALQMGAGCSRSANYKEEQEYYRSDGSGDSALGRAQAFGQPKRRLFVLAFSNETPVGGEELGTFIAGELLREIRGGGRAVVPEDIRSTSSSAEYFSGDKVRLTPLVRQGRTLGVSYLMVGRIKKVVFRNQGDDVGILRKRKAIAAVTLEMRLFDCAEGKEVFAIEKTVDEDSSRIEVFGSEDADSKHQRMELVRDALVAGARMLGRDTSRALDKVAWVGRIAKINAGRVYVNAGRASGLNIGDVLKVLTPGQDIYDPASGTFMGRAQGQPKGTLEVVDYFGSDGSVAAVHSGGGFTEGDQVQLY